MSTDQQVAPKQQPQPFVRHGHITPREEGGAALECGGPTRCSNCAAELEFVKLEYVRNAETSIRAEADRMVANAYRERTALLSGYARRWPSLLAYSDPQLPAWAVLTIEGPAGQMTWHIAQNDLELLQGVPWGNPRPWDQHTTAQKYERLAAAIAQDQATPLEPVFSELMEFTGRPHISINLPDDMDPEEIAKRIASLIEERAGETVKAAPPSPEQVLASACERIGERVASGVGNVVREALLAECGVPV